MKKYLLYYLLLALMLPFIGTGKAFAEAKGTGTEADPYNAEAACAAVAGLTWTSLTDYDTTEEVYVKGIISRIPAKGTYTESGTYGNASFYISEDGTENNEFYCFRILYLDNKQFEEGQTDIKVGDEVVVCGQLMNYKNNTPETVSGKAYLYSHKEKTDDSGDTGTSSGTGTLADPYNVSGACAAVAGLTWTSNTDYQTTEEVYVKGKISKIPAKGTYTESGTYGNASFYISDDGTETGEQFYCFRILYLDNQKYAGGTDIKVGDEVVVCGKLMNYKNNTPETESGKAYLYSLNEESSSEPAGTLAVNIAATSNGEVKADKETYEEGDVVTLTITPDEGYELESLTVKDASDADVEVTEDQFTMPATAVTVTATFKKSPVDVNITVESGKDIAAEVEAAADGAPIMSITVALKNGGSYTISKSLTSPGNVTINGNGATIDASGLSAPFITSSGATTKALKADGTESEYFEVSEITIKDVEITGLSNSLISNSSKTLFNKITVDNSVIEIIGSKAIFALGNGYPADLQITKSTLWSKDGHTGFLFQSHGKAVDINPDYKTSWSVDQSTLYQIGVGKKLNNTNTFKGKNYFVINLSNSILVNTGSSTGNEVNGWLFGQNSNTPTITYESNTYWSAATGGEAVAGWTDSSKQGSDQTETALESDPEFADAANGDFTVGAATDQAELKTGDPRWLVPFVGGEGDATDLLTEIDEARKLLKYSMTYYDEHNEVSPEKEAKALVDAIREAETQAEDGASQKKLDKTLEALKQAEIDYADALMEYELTESEAILATADPADELAAELQRLYDSQDVVREDYWNKPKNIKNYADELDKAQKAYLRKALNELLAEAEAFAEEPPVYKGIKIVNKALEGDSSEDMFNAYTNLRSAVDKEILARTPLDGNVATFEDLTLESESFWQGIYEEERDEDEIGICYNTFQSGSFQFDNYYSPDWGGYWGNFAYSNQTSSSYESLADQFHAVTGGGRESATFGVAFPQGGAIIYMDNEEGTMIPGFYITNSSYAYTSMLNGDAYAKKFEQGDWFKLTITGYDADENPVGTKEFYLADFRDEDSSKHYIVNDWRFVDLTGLGKVKSLKFILDSSDKGTWGMNTPGYFCLDDFGANGKETEPEGNITTAVKGIAVNDSAADAPVYNLAGQRVNGRAVKGIVIKNGKKYILK